MKVYVDTSFLVSLYSQDSNSTAAVQAMKKSSADHHISDFVELEFINALQLRVFRKELSTSEAQSSRKNFDKDISDGVFTLIPLTPPVFERARHLSSQTTARLGTRTADLLHVAAALDMNADYLYSFDQQQRKLAQVLGLRLN